jgi:hypothetical protein
MSLIWRAALDTSTAQIAEVAAARLWRNRTDSP